MLILFYLYVGLSNFLVSRNMVVVDDHDDPLYIMGPFSLFLNFKKFRN